jgi:hypothetical protein
MWKKLAQKYGIIFTFSYFGGFIVLVTLSARFGFDFPTFPGDLKYKFFYFPFTSSLAIAAFVTVLFEAYNMFRHV